MESIALTSSHQAYGSFILDHTPNYIQRKPPNVAKALQWPKADHIVDALGEMARLKWP